MSLKTGMSKDVARALSISRVNAGRCSTRGKKLLDNHKGLKDIAHYSTQSTNVPYYIIGCKGGRVQCNPMK